MLPVVIPVATDVVWLNTIVFVFAVLIVEVPATLSPVSAPVMVPVPEPVALIVMLFEFAVIVVVAVPARVRPVVAPESAPADDDGLTTTVLVLHVLVADV